MRVQFSVNNNEWEELQRLALKSGYPDVPSYCRDVSLVTKTYANIWTSVKAKIATMPSGTIFALRDLEKCPPANLGVKLYENQNKLNIKVNLKKDRNNTNTYTKL